MKKKIIFSGVQPSGNLHMGNYFGAIKHWVEGQDNGFNIFCIVDLHAITVPQSPETLKKNTLELVALLLASGIDPDKSILFVQYHNPDHANLAWVLNCLTSMSQLSRMTQYKEKAKKKSTTSVGLFDYPVLMAADILLYGTTHVPVGDDQKQHVELARDIAKRFNSRFGDTFTLPTPVIPDKAARVMSLLEPTKKMSKSHKNPGSRIHLLDKPDVIRKKIASAVTDSGSKVKYDWGKKPGISNLIEIYTQTTGKSPKQVEKEFEAKGYGEFKNAVSESIILILKPIQEKYKSLQESKELVKTLDKGAKKAYNLSHKTLLEAKKKVGFV